MSCKKQCKNVTQAVNTITQRMKFPMCITEVTVDAERLKDGDYAGMCALQGCYGMAAVTKRDGRMFLVMRSLEAEMTAGRKSGQQRRNRMGSSVG